MASKIEQLIVKLTSDGAGKVRAEIGGVADATRKIGESSTASNAGLATMAGTLRGLALGGVGLLGLREIVNGVRAVGKAALEAEASEKRLAGVLRATGADARTSAAEIEHLVAALSKRAGLGDDELRNAAALLASYKNLQGDTFREALSLGADWVALFGGDVVSATENIGRALNDPFDGVTRLARALGGLDQAEEASLKRFEELNDVAGAQKFALELLRGKMGGMAETMNTGLKASVNATKIAWDEFLEGIGKTDTFTETAKIALYGLERAAKTLTPGGLQHPGTDPDSGLGGVNAAIAAQRGFGPPSKTPGAAKDKVTTTNAATQADRAAAQAAASLAEQVRGLTTSLLQQANTFTGTAVEAVGYRIVAGDLATATAEQKSQVLLAAQALDDKRAIDAEVAHWDKLAAQAADEHTAAARAQATALDEMNQRANDRARDLADRGDKQAAANRKLEDDIFDVEAAFNNLELTGTERLAALQQAQDDFVAASKDNSSEWADAWTSAGNRFAAGIGDAYADMIIDGEVTAETFKTLIKSVTHQIISSLIELAIKKAVIERFNLAQASINNAALAAQGTAVAAAWAPAATLVSLGSAGTNAAPAQAGISSTYALTASIVGQAHDGLENVPRTGTYLLEEGEAVVQKDQNRKLREFLDGGGGGGRLAVTFNIRANDARGFDALLRARRGMIVNMMQQAYNSRARGRLGPQG